MRVTRLRRIENQRVFREFRWSSELLAFSRFNVIYGWNGSGKTTLSRLFAHLERQEPCPSVEFEIDGNPVMGPDLQGAVLPDVRVFNRDFVDASLSSSSGDLEPIFYVGKTSVEMSERVSQLRTRRAEAAQSATDAARLRADARREVADFLTHHARTIKEALRTSHPTPYQNYDKRGLERSLNAMTEEEAVVAILSESDQEELRRQKDAELRQDIPNLSGAEKRLAPVAEQALELARRSVVAATIDALRDDPEVSSWVQSGLRLHNSPRETDRCQFCLGELSARRRTELDAHFSDELKRLQHELQVMRRQVSDLRQDGSRLQYPMFDESRLYPHLRHEWTEATTSLADALTGFDGVCTAIDDVLARRLENVLEPLMIDSDVQTRAEDVDSRVAAGIEAVNALVTRHNETTAGFEQRVQDACRRLERALVADLRPEFVALQATAEAREAAHREVAGEPARLDTEIAELEGQLVEHLRPAEELNGELRAYLGRDELRFQSSDTGYAITRGGKRAHDLSEGERTAIAFLYFLKTLQDRSFDASRGVVVVDDPVSSLDAGALFSAFGYMKDRTKEAGQLIVLTHNFGFFKQVRNWFHHLPGQNKKDPTDHPARFYSLTSRFVDGNRTAILAPLDPLLRQYASEYHYLFRRIHEEASRPDGAGGLEEYYGLPNMARRLLESFLSFRYPALEGQLFKQLELVDHDAAAKVRILRFLHTYSHSVSVEVGEHDPSLLAEAPAVLQDVLELIRASDSGHYDGMLSAVGATDG